MKQIFNIKYIPYFGIFTLIWGYHLALKIRLPYFMISIPFILGAIYIIITSALFFIDHKRELLRTKKIQSFTYLLIVIYTIATIIKLQIVPSDQDFLRHTLFIIGAMFGISCMLFFDKIPLLKKFHSTFLKLYPYIFIFVFIPCMHLGATLVDSFVFYVALFFFLPQKYKWLAIFAIIFVILAPGQRMPLLRIISSFVFFILFKLNFFRNKLILKTVSFLLFSLPIAAYISAAIGSFNIFEISNYIGDYQYGKENLIEDTRTFLYEEATSSAINNNYVLLGRTFGYGYDSEWETIRKESTSNKIIQRNAEVFILNIFTWMGILGVIVFTILFFLSSYLAINCSRNIYIKYIGILVLIQWIFCWIETSMININYTQLIMWMEITMCLSPYWRYLTNEEFKNLMKYIFKV